MTEEIPLFAQSGWFGIEATKTKAIQDSAGSARSTNRNDPLSKGEYLGATIPAFGHDLEHPTSTAPTNRSRVKQSSPRAVAGRCNWWTLCANAKYYAEYYRTITQRNVQTYSVRPTTRSRSGTSVDQGAVTINSNADVLMNGAIYNPRWRHHGDQRRRRHHAQLGSSA